jgi:hypothetical protein
MAVAGYFYYYGMYYAGRCVELLPADQRPSRYRRLAGLLLERQEKNGSWFDFPLYDYHESYGTAMAIMTLSRCLEGLNPG